MVQESKKTNCIKFCLFYEKLGFLAQSLFDEKKILKNIRNTLNNEFQIYSIKVDSKLFFNSRLMTLKSNSD